MTSRNAKLGPETIEKIGLTAIGVGSAILFLADENFRNSIAKRLHQQHSAPRPSGSQGRPFRGTAKRTTRPAYSQSPTDFTATHPCQGVVYLLKAGPYYKIGKSVNFSKRLDQIKLQLPYPVEVIHRIASNDITAMERYWHRKFAHRLANGEWFMLSDDEVAEFKRAAKM
jgi:hypothetical protein